uniref:Uncharacterized protein n=1 Tax=Picea glauca TaxID=3330 RepID=A0A101M396_PICGL|nr:hypothetical protein ABT39_MTgene3360 [Picea glauca]QHR89124.1 hypothetical protein Q903MT_gene3143 [Picea sitchensis]
MVFWIMNDLIYSGNAIIGLWEEILGKRQPTRSYRMAFGGLLYLRMKRTMLRVVMFAKYFQAIPKELVSLASR